MLTLSLILVAVALVAGLVGMTWQMVNGSTWAWVWWVAGGAGDLCELLGQVLGAIADANR